MGRKTGE